MKHALHVAVAEEIEQRLNGFGELIRDPACGGNQHLPLFIGPRRGRDTRMCLVDLIVVSADKVRVIVEIEESGFHPTKICGKFLQSALSTHFIHDSRPEPTVPYADSALFIQVLDGSKCLKQGTRKKLQAELIERQIRSLLPLKGSTIEDYRLFFVSGVSDHAGLEAVGIAVREMLSPSTELQPTLLR
ncbi:MAG: hypothetical protein KKI12_03890 [Proteobacteria bacterium]|nr:hypothetical protein [Pseudomonadota bacterium]MBU4287298.1 hypothetical protein [Pseudomonadota bacterium]MCG2756917.1 hypothetical protein [Desulfobacteraceae bacterium]